MNKTYLIVLRRYFLGGTAMPAVVFLALWLLIPLPFGTDWWEKNGVNLPFYFFLPNCVIGVGLGYALKIACLAPKAGVLPACRQVHLFSGYLLLSLSLLFYAILGVWAGGFPLVGLTALALFSHSCGLVSGYLASPASILTAALVLVPDFLPDHLWDARLFAPAGVLGVAMLCAVAFRVLRVREGDWDCSLPMANPYRNWGSAWKETGQEGSWGIGSRRLGRGPAGWEERNWRERLRVVSQSFPSLGSERWMIFLPLLFFPVLFFFTERKTDLIAMVPLGILGMFVATQAFLRGVSLAPFLSLETLKPRSRKALCNDYVLAVLNSAFGLWLIGFLPLAAILLCIPSLLPTPILLLAASLISLVSGLSGVAGIACGVFDARMGRPVFLRSSLVRFAFLSAFILPPWFMVMIMEFPAPWIAGLSFGLILFELALAALLFFWGRRRWMEMDLP